MKTTVVLATRNEHKLREIAKILAGTPVTLRSLTDYPEIPEIDEYGETFAENALIKAREVFVITSYSIHYTKLYEEGDRRPGAEHHRAVLGRPEPQLGRVRPLGGVRNNFV